MHQQDKNQPVTKTATDLADLKLPLPSPRQEPAGTALVVKLQVALGQLQSISDQLGSSGLVALGKINQSVTWIYRVILANLLWIVSDLGINGSV